jgi:hypothetical protein
MTALKLLGMPSALMLVIAAATVTVAHSSLHRQQRFVQQLGVDGAPQQFGLELPSKAADFTAVNAALLKSISIDKQGDADANSVAHEGATSLLVSAQLKTQKLRLIPSSLEHSLGADEIPVAWVRYNNTMKTNGWAYLSAATSTDERVSREVKMYAAGFLEGLVSSQQIRDFQHNANALIADDENKHHAMGNIRALFEKQANTIVQHASMESGSTLSEANAPSDPWWRQARYSLVQAWGLLDAYNHKVAQVKGTPMSMVDLMILNSDGETPELETAYDMEETLLRQSEKDDPSYNPDDDDKQAFLQRKTAHRSESKHPNSVKRDRREQRRQEMASLNEKEWLRIKRASGRCSALVRLTKNNADLMLGHTTFSDYSEMTRVFKFYDFPLGDDAARKISFSSYPGVMGSTDDYYLMDTGLAVTETTISMLTDEPYDKLEDNGTLIPDFMRIMLSNRLAKTGQDWVNLMKKSSTGTYSSQWMVVDYNKFKPGKPLENGTLFVIEQVPGISHIQDATAHLQKEGYWGSENRAWFKDVRDSIGATEAEEVHGDLFSADKNPRAHIFANTAVQVQTLQDMRAEMRRNRWPDEVGPDTNTPEHAISARGDLNTESPDPNGGVDSKVTNACLAKRLQCDAISGPTTDTQKPFKWTDDKGKQRFPKAPHDGMPDLWNFDWVRMGPNGEGEQGC